MKYKHFLLTIMLLVASLVYPTVQGVYADSESGEDPLIEGDISAEANVVGGNVRTEARTGLRGDARVRARYDGGGYREDYRGDGYRYEYKEEYGPQGGGFRMEQKGMMPQPVGIPPGGMRFETRMEGEMFIAPPVAEFRHMDPIEMIINAMFQDAQSIDPAAYMQYCDDPETMVDKAIEALKTEGVWNDKSACTTLKEEAAHCKKRTSQCESILKFGGARFDKEKISCDELTEEKLYDRCVAQREKFSPQMKDTCEAEWKVKEYECKRQPTRNDPYCDKEQVVAEEERRGEAECSHLIRTREVTAEDGTVTTEEDRSEYDSCRDTYDGESAWTAREDLCEQRNSGGMDCDKEKFLDECGERNSQFGEENKERTEFDCKQQASDMYFGFSRSCAEQKKQYDRCTKQTEKMCTFFDTAVEKCNSVTDEELRTAMIAQAARMCKFKQYESGKERLQLRGQDISALVKQMQALREKAGLTERAVLDEQTEDFVDIAEKVEGVENKGIGYKLKWLVGAAAKSEKEDAVLLKKQAERLDATVATLKALVGQVTDTTTKAALEAQIALLEGQRTDIEELAEKKQKRSRGMFSFFFGGNDSAVAGETNVEIGEETL